MYGCEDKLWWGLGFDKVRVGAAIATPSVEESSKMRGDNFQNVLFYILKLLKND